MSKLKKKKQLSQPDGEKTGYNEEEESTEWGSMKNGVINGEKIKRRKKLKVKSN